MNIEDTICEEGLPVNTIVMANRLIEILKENDTNSALSLKEEGKEKFKKCLWLINQQIYSQTDVIDMIDEWKDLCRNLKEKK